MSAVSVSAFGGSPPAAMGLQQSMMNRGVGLGAPPMPVPPPRPDMAIPGAVRGAPNNNAAIQQRMFAAANPGQHQQIQSVAAHLRNQAAQAQRQGMPPAMAQQVAMQGLQNGAAAGPFGQSRMANPLNAMFGQAPYMGSRDAPTAPMMGMAGAMQGANNQLVGPMPFEGGNFNPFLGRFGQAEQQAPVPNAAPPMQAPIFGAARPKI